MYLRKAFSAIALAAALAAPALAADPTPKQAPAPTLPAISVLAASKAVLTDRVLASGIIEPVEQVSVQPQIEGQAIESLAVDVGAYVEEGEVLARLSTSALILQRSQLEATRASAAAAIAQAEAQQAEARAALDEALRVKERAESLSKKGISAKATADQARSNAEVAEARLNSAMQAGKSARAQVDVVDAQIADIDLKLARTEIKAPVSGQVVERNALVGSIASAAGKPMFVLVRDGQLELRADIAEQDVLRLAPGQKVTLKVAGIDQRLSGTVRLVEPTVNTQTRLGRVRIAIDDSSEVRWGMFADADIVTQSKEAVVLPVSAIGINSKGATALKVVDDKVEEVQVTTGIREGDLVEIVSGISEGDIVVARAGAFVRNGDRINPVRVDTTADVSN
jgi:HlyD family secretion protein